MIDKILIRPFQVIFKVSDKSMIILGLNAYHGDRPQTVRQQDNPRYWQLIEEFRKITGVPVVLNTSFNENEPIVCRREESYTVYQGNPAVAVKQRTITS